MLASKTTVASETHQQFSAVARIRAATNVDEISGLSSPAGEIQELLIEYGQVVETRRGQVLHDTGHQLPSIYLILEGLISVSLPDARKARVEVLTLGSGDFTALPFALNGQISPHRTVVHVPGSAVRLSVSDLIRLAAGHGLLRDRLLEAISLQCLRSSYLVACNARHSVTQRLSRWLLTASDQLRGPTVAVTHKLIADAIGVRRAGITTEVNKLQDQSILTTMRGALTIKDRSRLEGCACGCYEPVRTAHESRIQCNPSRISISISKTL
ncbi:MAG: Crp/Fnr family transcriptional regulator [Oxalobacteraceae bacterium]|nr:MAG: Crp/Fnr family transcriptional regulator [Oxalobacteraceae bacterium]